MNQTVTTEATTLREALYALSMAKDIPDAGTLDDVVRSYPRYSVQLTEFAIEMALECLRGDAAAAAAEAAIDPSVTSPAVARAMSRFQNRLHAVAAADTGARRLSPSAEVANPFDRLSRDRFRAVAATLNVNTAFLLKLRDRQIDPRTMPTAFPARVAEAMSAPMDLVVAHFHAHRAVGAGAKFFKADTKPNDGGCQSFDEAVRGSGLTEEQQRALLSL